MIHRFLLFAMTTTVCIAAGVSSALGQSDTLRTDTVRSRFLPTGIRVGYDLISAGKSYFQDDFGGWEILGDVDFDRYHLALEYGNWSKDRTSATADYHNRGNYWRVGVDVNFLTTDPERYMFFLGARYGRSVFTESMSVGREDPIWGSLSDTFHHSDVKAGWIELTTGLRVKIWQMIWLGYTARFKFALSDTGSPEMLPYDVPGFGLTDKETTWGFNYYLMIRLPVRRAPAPPGQP